jgi:hypothetical protein
MQNLYARLAPFLLGLIELLLLAAVAALIFFSSRNPSHDQPAFHLIERRLARLARHKGFSVLLVGLSVIAIRVALIPILGIPQPSAHDEFSYLLAADTFAHGKLTNPTHPMWIHFESFHIIEHPTYMSMYPPAQGLVLAAGQLLGNPWIGQILVTALMCSVLCWMLQAWLPPQWALLGAMLAVIRLGILSYWINGYWAASIVALGGTLVIGAWPRIRKHLRVRDALLMSLGLIILANSRPYEGLVVSLPVAAAGLWWLAGRGRPQLRLSFSRVVLPLLLALSCGALLTGYYYYRVTGSPFRMTYQVNRGIYSSANYFIWETRRTEPIYHHEAMREFYRGELSVFEENRTAIGYTRRSAEKFFRLWLFYLGPILTLPLLVLPRVVRDRKMRLPLVVCGAMAVGLAVETWAFPHYLAPATAALYLILVQCMRHLWHWFRGQRPLGQAWVRAIPALACAMILIRVAAVLTHTRIEPAWPRGNLERAALLPQLQQLPGQQLVIVSYGPQHDVNHEWVYNDADIDRSKVIWARDMGDTGNRELLRYFKDCRFWRVDGDSSEPKLESYEGSQ